VLGLIVIVLTGYFGYKAFANRNQETKYMLTQVKKGDISVSISGSGQISASNQITLQPKASGNLVYLGIKNGQFVKAGTLIVKIDTTDAQKAIRDAELNLGSAQLSFTQALGTSFTDEKSLKGQALSYMTIALNNTKNIIDNFQDIFFTDISGQSTDLKYSIEHYNRIVKTYAQDDVDYNTIISANFEIIKKENNINLALFSHLSQESSLEDIDNALNQVTETTKIVNDAVDLGYQLLNRYESILSDNNLTSNINVRNITTDKSTVAAYVTLVDTNIANLFSTQKSIKNFSEYSYSAIPFSVQSLQSALEQKENALEDAKEKLKNYYVYVPFDGEISQLGVSNGDAVSSATSLAILITNQKIAEISLNEMDMAKVKIGQQATLTFDALVDLTISGKVIEADPIGIESQGVVSYTIKISLEKNDERLKPGMTVNADIITETKQNILLLPNAAVKTQGNINYVELVNNPNASTPLEMKNGITLNTAPKRQTVKIGISNDEFTEILSGLNENDYVVLKTVNSNNKPQIQLLKKVCLAAIQ
jgi:HlyD family secretion protein